ncbi:MAG: hypothetical protein GW921_04100, partial [Gallionella sp.]|nr:hypothetical protein [Gallionella sp.]
MASPPKIRLVRNDNEASIAEFKAIQEARTQLEAETQAEFSAQARARAEAHARSLAHKHEAPPGESLPDGLSRDRSKLAEAAQDKDGVEQRVARELLDKLLTEIRRPDESQAELAQREQAELSQRLEAEERVRAAREAKAKSATELQAVIAQQRQNEWAMRQRAEAEIVAIRHSLEELNAQTAKAVGERVAADQVQRNLAA